MRITLWTTEIAVQKRNNQMADNEMIAQNCQEGWKAFSRLAALSTAAVFLALALMGLFLL
jgi:hypothetical protein